MPDPTPSRDSRDLRAAFAKEARLYGLGLVCATPAALAVWRTGSVWVGVLVFLAVLGVAGSALFAYERRLSARRRAAAEPARTARQIARERARLAAAAQGVRDEARRLEQEQQQAAPQPPQQPRGGGAARGRGRRGGRRR